MAASHSQQHRTPVNTDGSNRSSRPVDLADAIHEMLRLNAANCRRGRSGLPGSERFFRDKKIAEAGVVGDLVIELAKVGVAYSEILGRVETSPPSPPDVLGRNSEGGLVGFEVTELLAREVMELNIAQRENARAAMRLTATADELARERDDPGIERHVSQSNRVAAYDQFPQAYFEWTPESLRGAIRSIVDSKRQKPFMQDADEQYDERILVIHTDEPAISCHTAQTALHLGTIEIAPFDAVWLVLGFQPDLAGDGRYPTFRVG
jgi:hypothetical protein